MSFEEANRILKNAFKYTHWTPEMYSEAERICYQFAEQYSDIDSNQEQYEFLHTVCNYLYLYQVYQKNKSDGGPKSIEALSELSSRGIQYCEMFEIKYPDKILTSKFYLPNIFLYKAHFLIALDRHLDAYHAISKSKEISKDRNLPYNVSLAYGNMAYIVDLLDLSDQALADYDSAFAAIKTKPESDKRAAEQRVYILLGKQLSFLSKHRKTGQEKWADSVFKMHNFIKSEDRQFHGSVEAESFIAMAAVAYNKKNYLRAISRIDSAFKIYPNIHALGSVNDALAYKALSLLKLGEELAGRSLFDTLNYSRLSDPVMIETLEELYKYEKRRGNLSSALSYHEQLLDYVKKKELLDLRGKALEMEQFYQVKRKEQQIMLLEGSKRQNLIVAGFMIFIVMCALVIAIIRYKSSRLKTRKLVSQIDEVVQSQVLLIHEAEENERKRMAQNLHDDIAGSIASSVNYLRMLSDQFAGNGKIDKDLRDIANMLEESYDTVRGLSHSLFSNGGNAKFISKIEEQVNLLPVVSNMTVHLHAELEETPISTEFKTAILLILKEAINNIIKHSMASEVRILLYLDVEDVIFEISDDGKGFTTDRNTETLGLKSIQDRVRRLNGKFKLLSGLNQRGVSIIMNFPLQLVTKKPLPVQ
jgi:signal transduction histidine kinase